VNLAGYIVRSPGGDSGTRGSAYTYVLAGDGLWLEADNGILKARACLAPVPVRGLPPAESLLELRHGRISAHLLSLAVAAFSARADLEAYAAIAWDGQSYRLVFPPQEGSCGAVTYEPVPGTVVGLHSHGRMGAFFSGTDDRDDQGFLVSVVVGKLDRLVPAAGARLCIYGYLAPADLREVFAGLPPWIEEFGEPDYE
jgi:PRTRC genetic system protein A